MVSGATSPGSIAGRSRGRWPAPALVATDPGDCRARRQLAVPIKSAVWRTAILGIAEKREALIAEPVEVSQCLLDISLFHSRWRMSLQVSGRLQGLLARIAGPSSTATRTSAKTCRTLRAIRSAASPGLSRSISTEIQDSAIPFGEKEEFSSVITSTRCPIGSRRTCSWG